MIYGYTFPTVIDENSSNVYIEYDEGWGMIPQPKFGCIHHEEK
jgi:hypothetical protein